MQSDKKNEEDGAEELSDYHWCSDRNKQLLVWKWHTKQQFSQAVDSPSLKI